MPGAAVEEDEDAMTRLFTAEPDTGDETSAALDTEPHPGKHRGGPTDPTRGTGWLDPTASWVGRLVTIAAIWSAVSIPLRRWVGVRWIDVAFQSVNLPVGPSLFTVVLLFVLGNALRRRLRFALLVTIVLFQVTAAFTGLVVLVASLSQGRFKNASVDLDASSAIFSLISGAVGLVLIVLLFKLRPAFPARLRPGSRVSSLIVLFIGLATSAIVSIVLTEAFPHNLGGMRERVVWALRVVIGLTPDATSTAFHGHRGHHWVDAFVGLLSAAALVAAAVTFLRSSRSTQYLGASDELEVRRLLLESGERDSLGYFATRRDKSVVFSANHRAAITYRVIASCCLASGDPIGHPGTWPDAIDAWLAQARRFGWFPAVLAASEEGAKAYVDAGLKAMPIGDEAVVDVDGFSLEGRTMQPVRRAVHRLQRAGYTLRVRRHSELDAEQIADLERLAERWRGDESERGFSMALGRLGDPVDGRSVMVTAHDTDGTVRGLLSFVPWGSRGISLDLMRRDRSAENGLTEFMISGLIAGCHDIGIRRISLNFAMFRGIFRAAERVGVGPVVRATNAVLSVASRFWQLESLYRSNAKYLPGWIPRFLCYDSSLTLTRAAVAAAMAEGFLPSPAPIVRRGAGDTVVWEGRQGVLFTEAAAAQQLKLLRAAVPTQRLTEQQRTRHDKLKRLAALGIEPYPVAVPRTMSVRQLRDQHHGLAAGSRTGCTGISVAGRVRALRDFGGLAFAVIQDEGASVQAILTREALGREQQRLFKRGVDLGDHISVTGEVIASDRGELSILASAWTLGAKCLRPLPDAHAGFSDPDARVRQRYLDFIVNPDSLNTLRQRTVAVKRLREALGERAFVEVETPMLQSVHGGANARPFRTHINAYDMELYLRIAPELFLKRLCVAGMGRVFELNRNFRNEGADATHNPEFTSLELYQAYADYLTMRELTRDVILDVATALHGSPVAHRTDADGKPFMVNLDKEWPFVPVHRAVSQACGTEITPDTPAEEVRAVCRRWHVHTATNASAGYLVLDLYDALVEPNTLEPTFYCDFPVETSPLTRVHRQDPRLSERWDLVAFGAEIGTAYSELIDPIEQRHRLTSQSLLAAHGDPEAMQVDEAFLTALEYSMPPTGGLGIGVDRLVMMLTGTSIRATLAFPFVRPHTLD